MDSITVLHFEIGPELLIAFPVLEFIFTLLKTYLFEKRYARAGILCFILESTIGILLTFITCFSLFNRTVSWKRYPLVASIGLALFETCLVLLEVTLVSMMTRNIHREEGQDYHNNSGANVPKNNKLFIFKLAFICFLYPLIFLAIIVLKRRTMEKSGDRAVEITTVISLFYSCLHILFVSAPSLIFGQVLIDKTTGRVLGLDCENPATCIDDDSSSEEEENTLGAMLSKFIEKCRDLIDPFSPIKVCFTIGMWFSGVSLLTAVIQTFRRSKYIDSGIVTIFMVIGPGSFSVSAFSGKLITLQQNLKETTSKDAISSSDAF